MAIYFYFFTGLKCSVGGKKGPNLYFLDICITELSYDESLLEGTGLVLWLSPSIDAAKISTWKEQSAPPFVFHMTLTLR